MIKQILSLLLLMSAPAANLLFGFLHPDVNKCENWSIGAEYLYWLPEVGAADFVVKSRSAVTAIGTIETNNPRFQSGFRVEGAFGLNCDVDIHGRYAWFLGSKRRTINGNLLYEFEGEVQNGFDGAIAGFSYNKYYLSFQRAELLASTKILDGLSCSNFYLFAGLQFYSAKLQKHYNYTRITPLSIINVNQSNRNFAVGPESGFEFDVPLKYLMRRCGCREINLSFVGQVSGSILAQQERVHLFFGNQVTRVVFYDLSTNHTWRVIPAWDARLGLAYEGSACSKDYKIEIGYEFLSYVNALKKYSKKTNLASGTSVIGSGFFTTVTEDLGFQGMYLTLGVSF